jgi:hypothetical protein
MLSKTQAILQQLEDLVCALELACAKNHFEKLTKRRKSIQEAIARLEHQTKPVPDELMLEKMDLDLEIATADESLEACRMLSDDLGRKCVRLSNLDGSRRTQDRPSRNTSFTSTCSTGKTPVIPHKGSVKHTKPIAFEIDGSQMIDVRTWKEMLVKGSRYLLEKQASCQQYPEGFFSKSPEGLSRPRRIVEGVYVNAEKNSEMIVDFMERLLKAMNRPASSLVIYTK